MIRGFVRRWQSELGDTYVLGLVRVALGAMLFWQTLRSAQELTTRGYFGDVFHLPFLPEALVPSRLVYTVLIAVELIVAALAAVGHRARAALCVGSLLGLYFLLCDRVEFHHNRYALCLFAFLVSLAPCDRSFTITGPVLSEGERTGPLWAQRLAQLQLSIIYLASGGAKLLDPDWRDGRVLLVRLTMYGYKALERGVPQGVVDFVSQPTVTSALAKAAIATELLLSFALWNKRARIYALWWGVMFHLTIEVTSPVEIFTWLTLTAYGLFVTPDTRARKFFFDPSRPRAKLTARLVRALDWFARFEVKPWAPDGLKKGHSMVVVRRDATRATGIRAVAMLARCLPLLFPLWAPLMLIASFTRGGDASSRG
jgi:HTTM domain